VGARTGDAECEGCHGVHVGKAGRLVGVCHVEFFFDRPSVMGKSRLSGPKATQRQHSDSGAERWSYSGLDAQACCSASSPDLAVTFFAS
jgi:hypothetical protein